MGRTSAYCPSRLHHLQMNRFLLNASAFLWGFALSGFLVFGSARAETIDASSGYAWSNTAPACPGSGSATSVDDAWQAVAASFNSTPACTGDGAYIYSYQGVPGQVCYSNNGGPLTCYSPNTVTVSSTYTCPPDGGWILSGSSCTRPDCEAGEIRQADGSCVLQPTCGTAQTYNAETNTCECPAAGTNAMLGGAAAWGIAGSPSSCISGGANYGGCNMACSGGAGYTGNSSCTGCTFDGTASPESSTAAVPLPPTSPEQQCIDQGKCPISINGIVSCGTCGSTAYQQSTTTTNPDTSQTSRSQVVSVTYNPDGTVTATTSTTTDGQTTTTTETQPATSWCASNPGDPACRAVEDECKANPTRPGCLELGEAADDETLETKTLGVESIAVVDFGSTTAACPAPIPLPHGAELSFDWTCDLLEGVRPILLALAWLTAGMIVLGFNRES